jgi:Fur family peroxide stress response transcriptional regulator
MWRIEKRQTAKLQLIQLRKSWAGPLTLRSSCNNLPTNKHLHERNLRKPESHPKLPLARLETACRRHGIPATVQRRVIFTALLERTDHPTVDQVFEDVKERIPGVSRTTVYRTLETLANLGLARRTNHFAASARFDGNMEQHHHLVCTTCSKVVDYQDENLAVVNAPDGRRHGFTVVDYSVYFEGVCADCKSTAAAARKETKKPKPSAKEMNRAQ